MTRALDHIRRVVVVGASTAGLATVESLRAEGFAGEIMLLGDEPYLPYQRPALSKQILQGAWGPEDAALVRPELFEELDVTFLSGSRATGLDCDSRMISVGRDTVAYDAVVIATGAVAHRPAWADDRSLVHHLRSLDDAVTIANGLESAARVTVVGTGILGSEVAAAARQRGAQVTLVGRSVGLSLGSAGPRFSDRIRALHESNGVTVRTGTDVVAVTKQGSEICVHLSDGTSIGSDLVVAAVGCRPASEWLASSGLLQGTDLPADSCGRVADRVYAAGDVSAWLDPSTGKRTRSEHQLTAMEQGRAVGRFVATGQRSGYPVPFFWSELYGTRIQAFGRLEGAESIELLAGNVHSANALYGFRNNGRLSGLVGWNMPRDFRISRAAIMNAEIARSSPHDIETKAVS